ncbi:AAA family ATPase [Candidatus Nitrosocosmicus oleophilus]|uniref:AAA family ATPase n=1 Tax=Candidatus Nitrosocosmicus oleophilus TaxID=1353260 RepID=UPI0018CBAF52|nr:AAA family ATPase [Candidatus Nitrosocosmicus oleophilus]
MSRADSILKLVKTSYSTSPTFKQATFFGVPHNYKDIKTLGDLLEINYKYQPVKNQLRQNLISKIKNNENPFVGIIGFDDTVIPAIKRALLAGHDILFVGHIGQGKTKLAELISENLLSPIPIVEGTLTNDIPTEMPYTHLVDLLNGNSIDKMLPEFYVSKDCEELIKNNGLDTKIKWLDGKQRYRYILATPDISVKDLVGQIDVVKIIKKGIEVFDIDSYSPGYLLQARYGILCLDELPVLDPRKQVTLLSVLQEGRFTTGAYPVFFKPDVKIIATANPIDYTHSGKIIEPLADRLKSHIETHYPNTIDDETLILVQEMDMLNRDQTFLPIFMLKTITRIFQKIRNHPDINSDRGVSVRSTIHSLEAIVGEVERARSLVNNVKTIPRFSDLQCIFQSSKFELDEIEDTTENKTIFLNNIINEVIQETCLHFFNEFFKPQDLISIKNEFRNKSFIVVQNQYKRTSAQSVSTAEGTNFAKESKTGSYLYTDQLRHLPVISKTLRGVIAKIRQEQDYFVQKARQNEIDKNLQYIQFEGVWKDKEDSNEELLATSSELLFEYLRFSSPPILDKREDTFEIRE